MSLESEETELSRTRYQQGSIRRLKRKYGPDVWVFRWRNTHTDGSRKESTRVTVKKPFRANSLLRRHMKTAVDKAGIDGPVGWHTFRRSISTWLIENDENVKVAQELLRHAHPSILLDRYAKAVTKSKRRAHERIVDDLLGAQQQQMLGKEAVTGGLVN